MKITKSELKTLIQEEVKRQKTVIELTNKKKAILKQLNEMEYDMEEMSMSEEGEMDEIFGLEKTKFGQAVGMKTPEQKMANAMNLIKTHPAKAKFYNQEKAISPERAAAYAKYVSEHPNDLEGVFFDEKQKRYRPLSERGLENKPLMQRLGAGAGSLTGGGGAGAKAK